MDEPERRELTVKLLATPSVGNASMARATSADRSTVSYGLVLARAEQIEGKWCGTLAVEWRCGPLELAPYHLVSGDGPWDVQVVCEEYPPAIEGSMHIYIVTSEELPPLLRP